VPTKSFAIAKQNNGSGITSETTSTFDSTGFTHLVVFVKHEGSSQTITPSDNKGSTGWSSGTKQGNRAADSWGQFHYVKIGTPGTGHTVTVTFTSASFTTILVWLVNSSTGEIALDAQSVAPSPSDTTAIDAGSLVTSGASVVSFMGVAEYAVCIYTAGSGWTEDHDANGPNWTYGQSRGPETTSPIDPVATGNSAMDWAACSAAFREAAGGGGGTAVPVFRRHYQNLQTR
jgi:hypothetical protein